MLLEVPFNWGRDKWGWSSFIKTIIIIHDIIISTSYLFPQKWKESNWKRWYFFGLYSWEKKRGIKILPTCQDEPCCPAVVAEPCVCLRAPIYIASPSPPYPPTPALTLNFPRQTPPTCWVFTSLGDLKISDTNRGKAIKEGALSKQC